MKAETIRVLEQAITLLRYVGANQGRFGLNDIGQQLGLAKSTAHRFLSTLEGQGLLRRDGETQRYRLGLGLLELAQAFRLENHLISSSLPAMRQLCDLTQETISLHQRLRQERICVAELLSPYPVRYMHGVGSVAPLHGGAQGKALLAFLPPQEQQEVLHQLRLHPITPRTFTDPRRLKQELARIRRRGYATSVGEVVEGAAALAAPIWELGGKLAAVLSLTAPSSRMDASRRRDHAKLLLEATAEISRQLGFAARTPQGLTASTAPSPLPARTRVRRRRNAVRI